MLKNIIKLESNSLKLTNLQMWLSVDPMSDKYPSMSPYHYCANNPVILVDPDGREIWIVIDDIKIRYENGNLYNSDGSSYNGEVTGFLAKTVTSLNEIRSSDAGNLVTELEQKDGFNVEIRSNLVSNCAENSIMESGSDQKNYIGAFIGLSESGTSVPISDFPPFMGGESMTADLGHELSHAMDMKNNNYDPTQVIDGVRKSDYKAVYNENLVRQKINVPLRTHYSRCRNEDSIQIYGCGPRMVRNGVPYLRSF